MTDKRSSTARLVIQRFDMTREQAEFISRRTRPFLDGYRPINQLLEEAYVQGLHDAMDIYEGRANP